MNRILPLFLLLTVSGAADPLEAQAPRRPVAVQDLITVRKPSEVQISPDGKWVAFVQTTPDLERNSHLHDLYVVPTDGSAPPRKVTNNEPRDGYLASRDGLSPVWGPASDRLVYVARRGEQTQIYALDVRAGQESLLVTAKELGEKTTLAPGFRGRSIAFSPDGRQLAFLATETEAAVKAPAEKLLRGIEADEDWTPTGGREPVSQLMVMDLESRRVRSMTGGEMNVAAFAWSPDGRRLAIEGSAYLGRANYMEGDIWIADLAGGAPRRIVQLDGWDQKPAWSPDGRSIAFGTQRGKPDWMYTSSLAIVDADGRTPPRFIGDALDALAGAGLGSLQWTRDGRFVDVVSIYKLGQHLFRVRVADGQADRLTTRDDRYHDGFSYSADGSLVALTMEGAAVPADVYVSPVQTFAPRRLTTLNPGWDAIAVPTVEIVKWRARDGKFDIHGLLLKPSSYDASRRYPMLTAVIGGPSMVRQRLNPIWNYPLLTLAERGYVVLLPNSRGRPGMGMPFTHAIRDERSYLLGGHGDVIAGVDEMVARRIADPDRLGILGFSYGGSMTALTITHTDRFKAAIYGEGAPSILESVSEYPTKHFMGLFKDMWGLPTAFEADDIKRMFEQSAIYRSQHVKTPVLVEAGERSAWKTDRQYFRSLRHFGVPSEFYVYPRSGHGWDEPKLMQDAYARHIRWFDYWLLDKPYGDAEKQRAYDEWKKRRLTQSSAGR